MNDVCDWVDGLGLCQYRKKFMHNVVGGALLLRLNDTLLRTELGIGPLVSWWIAFCTGCCSTSSTESALVPVGFTAARHAMKPCCVNRSDTVLTCDWLDCDCCRDTECLSRTVWRRLPQPTCSRLPQQHWQESALRTIVAMRQLATAAAPAWPQQCWLQASSHSRPASAAAAAAAHTMAAAAALAWRVLAAAALQQQAVLTGVQQLVMVAVRVCGVHRGPPALHARASLLAGLPALW